MGIVLVSTYYLLIFLTLSYQKTLRRRSVNDDATIEPTLEPPSSLTIFRASDNIVVNRGDNVILECETGLGQPAPVIVWARNNEPIQVSPTSDTMEEDPPEPNRLDKTSTKARLFLPCVTAADSGLYRCIASNGYATINHNVSVVVRGSDETGNPCDSNQPPRIYMWTTDAIEHEGSNIRLLCRAKGNPTPTIEWYRLGRDNSQDRRIVDSDPMFKILPTGDLLILHPDAKTLGVAGVLKCVAKNLYGQDEAESFVLITRADTDELRSA